MIKKMYFKHCYLEIEIKDNKIVRMWLIPTCKRKAMFWIFINSRDDNFRTEWIEPNETVDCEPSIDLFTEYLKSREKIMCRVRFYDDYEDSEFTQTHDILECITPKTVKKTPVWAMKGPSLLG